MPPPPSPYPSLILARGITPIPSLDHEIISTIPSHGTGESLTDWQLRLLLRCSLKERCTRASKLWDGKGRAGRLRRDFYDGLTVVELAEVGLQRVTVGGERRDTNSDRARNFKVMDSQWVAGWAAAQNQILGRGGAATGRGYGVTLAGGMDGGVDVRFVEGADTALALLGSQLNPPVDDQGRMKVMVVWLHSMDVLAQQDTPESSDSGLSEADIDGEEENEEVEYHSRGLLLDTDHITVGKFLHQLDTVIIQEYPCDDWAFLKLHKVVLGACDDDDLDEENPHPDLSEVVECLEIFVGYAYVGEVVARAARDAWEREYWRGQEDDG
ncbi:hypothetical protein DL98DRAFT_587134 [Cadophora sp. DSE1049]|nr:hypothetical protein DL98DRAFT_587134 [Cadophora sp. DSE1049]